MIHLENLTKEYDQASGQPAQIVAAERLNLDVAEREIFGLVGPNGSGKTTTLKMICGLLVPTSGRVTVDGIDVESRPEDAQGAIGYLADFFSLYDDLKVWEYLDYFAHAYKMDEAVIAPRVEEVIRQMGLETKRDSFISGLSRGMKQRLGLGRAIIHHPKVLVLDEPAAGLDPKARHELKELLRELNRAGTTVFITSHILADLEEICTSIGILEKGHLVRVGRLEQVMREPAAAGRRYFIRLALGGFALGEWLAARAGVSDVKAQEASAEFSLTGGDIDLAALVHDLAAAGAPICAVEERVETLEKLFSRLSTGEVM